MFFPKRSRKLIFMVGITLLVIIGLIFFFKGKHPFSRRVLNEIQENINSFGDFSPIAVVGLTLISTAIPPLPLPVPLIEIASGLVFGFWQGFFYSLLAQVISSLFAFYLARYFAKRILKRFIKYEFLEFYIKYLQRSGPRAVLITRAAMVAPFNVVSYLAGLTEMRVTSFFAATLIGCIPEAAIYAFIGSVIKTTHVRLWYVFVAVLILGGLGLIATYVMIEISRPRDL